MVLSSAMLPKTLLIIWHSRTGGSEALARAAARGASAAPEVRLDFRRAEDADAAVLFAADAYLFIAPENLASLSGAMKEMFDRTYYDCLGRLEGRPYASIICAGSDGMGAQRQLDRIATGWRLRRVAEGMIVITGAQTDEAIWAEKVIAARELAAAEELGAAMAEGLTSGVF
jgi:multimeric flavodoxin WrbA